IMGEPLSPDRVFDFPEDEPKPHPAYDFFAPGLLPRYAVDMEEEQMAALVIDMEEHLVALFGEDDDFEDDDFSDDDSEGVEEEEPSSVYEVGGPSIAAAEGPSFPLPAPGLPVPPAMIEELSTRLGNLEYGHGQLVSAQVEQGQQTATQRDETIAELTQQV
nr:hypothetical protein [Tanacetum cinerariifolium]